MIKILRTAEICGFFTVDIEGNYHDIHMGDTVEDDLANIYTVKSVAISGSRREDVTTLVLEKVKTTAELGEYLILFDEKR